MKKIVLIILLLFAAFLLTAEVKNPDKPLKGSLSASGGQGGSF